MNGKIPHILVADVNPKFIRFFKRTFRNAGYNTTFLTSTEEILLFLETNFVDLIILNVKINQQDGFTICNKIKSSSRIKNLPIIFLSKQKKKKELKAVLEFGGVDYITPPFDSTEILMKVNVHLELNHSREKIIEYNKELTKNSEKLKKEIEEAKLYVQSVLPTQSKVFVKTDWKFYPSSQLGGDSLGYQWLDKDNFAFYLFDISGHGVVAAMLSITIINMLRTQSLPSTDFYNPHSVLTSLNDNFQMERNGGKHFSIWYGVYNRSKKEIVFASAGHPPALLISSSNPNSQYELLNSQGDLIGINYHPYFEMKTKKIKRGDTLYLYSDGCYEFENKNGKWFGLNSFVQLVANKSICNHDLDCIEKELWAMYGKDNYEDDFTVLQVGFR
jgi:sigma-B regulation protein RsbU (phosphoserine phosphatase)